MISINFATHSTAVREFLRSIFFVLLCSFCTSVYGGTPLSLKAMKGFPNTEQGYDKGVSACFAGTLDQYLLIAGGCNFPDIPHDQGGKKKYYSGVYAAKIGIGKTLKWNKVGQLPAAGAYGVSITIPNGIIIIGGNNEKGATSGVYLIRWNSTKEKGHCVHIDTLPSLPYAVDNMTGCQAGNMIAIAGGNVNGRASNNAVYLDLTHIDKGWNRMPSFPGASRIQSISASATFNGDTCMVLTGGFRPPIGKRLSVLSMGSLRYSFNNTQWTLIAPSDNAPAKDIFLGGGAAASIDNTSILALGGVNKDIFEAALNHPQPDYLTHPIEWYKFNKHILVYNAANNSWQQIGESPVTARAGAALVAYKKCFFLIGGETKPGIRTPTVYRLQLK